MTQAPKAIRDWDTVLPDDLRPAGNGKDCFYCGQPLDGKHKDDCVILAGAGSYYVAIQNNDTREIRRYRYDMEWDESSAYAWTDGNFGCDCNRALFFARAAGENDPEDRGCGITLYSALYAELSDGRRIQIDDAIG